MKDDIPFHIQWKNNVRGETPGFQADDQPAPNCEPSRCAVQRSVLEAELTQQHLSTILQSVPGGSANVQDIYPLAPLQEGMLFHRLLNEQSDTYVLSTLFELESSASVDALINALQKVIDRHDALRTAVLWANLPLPVQVVCRQATLPVHRITLQPGRDAPEQMTERMRPGLQTLILSDAPLAQLQIAADPANSRWLALLQLHHLVCDFQSLNGVISEAISCLQGREDELPTPIAYRTYVEQALSKGPAQRAEAYFRQKLGDIEAPTAPFGVLDVRGEGLPMGEATRVIERALTQKIRHQAKRMNVSAARLFHAAWALVVARTSAQDDVVFGTVVLAVHQRAAQTHRMLGMSVNTLPLRIRVAGVTAEGLIERTHQEIQQLLEHEHASLTLAHRCSGISGTSPLFTSLLNFRHRAGGEAERQQGSPDGIRVLKRGEAWTNYPVTLIVDDLGEEFLLTAQTVPTINPGAIAHYVDTALRSLMIALESEPRRPATALEVLPADERLRIIRSFNDTQAPYPRDRTIHQMFEAQVHRTPDAVAVVSGLERLTYRDLNRSANQLAHHLRSMGVAAECCVGLFVERGLHMVVGLLGILKAGGAYVPLDPNYPAERLEFILRDASPTLIVTQERLRRRLTTGTPIVALDAEWEWISQQPTTGPIQDEAASKARNLAYIIYTSGSTGRPKGVAIEHRNAVNLIYWAGSSLPRHVFERTLQSTSLNFDLSVYECFTPLSVGGSIYVSENALSLEGLQVATTLVNTVPSAISGLLESRSIPDTTHIVNLAGEPLKEELVKSIFEHSRAEAVGNLYGPSETTTYSTSVYMTRECGFDSSIGRPIANTQVYILDRHLQPVPIGVPGEIYIGGDGVARGYLNRPDLTAERFLADPFNADPAARIYKTGDIGSWREDGMICYQGRNDHQVKIRGYRIEPGEIEARLSQHARISEAAVLAREDAPGRKRLVAYVVPVDALDSPSIEELRGYLKATLPEYMVPAAFVVIERMPLTQSGKRDRNALPPPEMDSYFTREYEAPQGELETTIASMWCRVLNVERVGRHDDFFDLGGHSLLTMQLIARLQSSLSIELPIRVMFDFPTLATFSEKVSDIRRKRVHDSVEEGSKEIDKLLEQVAAMPEGEVESLLSKLRI